MKKLIHFLRHPNVVRVALALYVLCLCAVIFVYLVVSAMEVPTAIYVRGPQEVSVDGPLVLRGHVLDAQNGQRLKRLHRIEASLDCTGRPAITLSEAEIEPDGELSLTHTFNEEVVSATLEPTRCDLTFDLSREPGSPSFIASTTITLTPAPSRTPPSWPEQVERRPIAKDNQNKARALPRLGVTREALKGEEQGDADAPPGEVRVALVERHPVLSKGLPGEVTILTSDRESGEPRSCEVLFASSRGIVEGELPSSVRTNSIGLARVTLTPSTLQVWDLEARCEGYSSGEGDAPQGSARIQIDVAATQYKIARPTSSLLRAGREEVALHFASVHKQGAVVVDLYRESQWLSTGRYGLRDHSGGALARLDASAPGLYRAQIYEDSYDPGLSWDVQHLWVGRDIEEPLDDAIDALLAMYVEHIEDEVDARPFRYLKEQAEEAWRNRASKEKRALFSALLHGLPATFVQGEVLLNSFYEDQQELEAWKTSVRGDLLLVVGAALLTGLAMLFLAILWGIEQRAKRQRLYDELEEELDDSTRDASHLAARAKRQRAERVMLWVQGGVLFGTLVVFAASIWMLMRYMM